MKEHKTEGLNRICIHCITDCPGTKNQVWTGCTDRQTKKKQKEEKK